VTNREAAKTSHGKNGVQRAQAFKLRLGSWGKAGLSSDCLVFIAKL